MVHFTLVPGLRDPLFSAVSFGWAGVDLFFVLSGYLITSILLKSRAEPHYFQTFYTNRVLRIFPLYYTFLFGCLFFVPASFAHQAWYWLYLENFLNAWGKSIPVMNLSGLWPLRNSSIWCGPWWFGSCPRAGLPKCARC